jgi:hypothetical protein
MSRMETRTCAASRCQRSRSGARTCELDLFSRLADRPARRIPRRSDRARSGGQSWAYSPQADNAAFARRIILDAIDRLAGQLRVPGDLRYADRLHDLGVWHMSESAVDGVCLAAVGLGVHDQTARRSCSKICRRCPPRTQRCRRLNSCPGPHRRGLHRIA